MAENLPPLLLHVFPSFAVGGAQMRFVALANRFGRRWRHAIVALDGDTACRTRLATELDVTFPALVTDKADPWGNIQRIRRLLRTLRPATLVTSNWGAIEWAFANLIPLARHVHTEDGFGPEERSAQLPRRVWARRLALRRSAVVLPSRTLLRIATDTWRLHPARLHYIPNGVDLLRYAGGRAAPGEIPVIGVVAALRPEKNVGRLLHAFSRVPQPARLVVVGDGPEREKLQGLATELGVADRVRFDGQVASPDYGEFDVFALSSDTEQMPLSVLEAMAAGLAVASTDVGDVRTMVGAANQRFVVPADSDALGRALTTLVADLELRCSLGAANRAHAESHYDHETMFQAYAALYQP